MDRISPEQSRVLEGFRSFHARVQRLPSSAEAQASASKRPEEIAPYREVMAAFPGRTWTEIRTLAARYLGLDVGEVTRRRPAVAAPGVPQPAPATATPREAVPDASLSDPQFELLWEVSRVPRLVDELDKRTVRALVSRGLATIEGEWLRGTDVARAAVREHLQSCAAAGRSGRISVLYRALLTLEQALVSGAEVRMGRVIASADDIVIGLYRKGRAMR